MEPMRLQKYLAQCGVASRRAAEKLIAEGHVSVNGTVVTEMGVKVTGKERILVDGKPVKQYIFRQNYYWMASNNPVNLFDSRLFGLVPHSHVVGRAFRIWYSPDSKRIFQPVQ